MEPTKAKPLKGPKPTKLVKLMKTRETHDKAAILPAPGWPVRNDNLRTWRRGDGIYADG
jgi:hypothetical protein